MGPLGLTLLLLALACSPPFHHEMGVGSGVTLHVDAPHQRLKYPDEARLRVTVRNRGDAPFTLDWPPHVRLVPGSCTRELQREPIEVTFSGETLDRAMVGTPYVWRWRAPSQPRQLTIQPGASQVLADVTFEPPKGVHLLTGTFCVRVYGYDLPGGVVYRGLDR